MGKRKRDSERRKGREKEMDGELEKEGCGCLRGAGSEKSFIN